MLFNGLLYLICLQKVYLLPAHTESPDQSPIRSLIKPTRRILRGRVVEDTRPYMVYLRPALARKDYGKTIEINSNWLCGGVIIHSQYILTSAACIEDVQQFYVVSGTHKWLPLGEEDECVKNGAKKAIWKCVPKDYVFDGKDYHNIRWMINDIAVVKVDEEFNFERRIRGCDFIPKMIAYNNQSESLEAAGTVASIAGWGSVDRFGDTFGRSTMNSPDLLETDVILISKKKCQRQWPERYHQIIQENMVCAKDGVDSDSVSLLCREKQINCKELVYSDEEEDENRVRRFMLEPSTLQIHSSGHLNETRRKKTASGGFCETRNFNKYFQKKKHKVNSSINVATTLPPNVHNILQKTNINIVKSVLNGSRRIINGEESRNTRPYVVYLKLPSNDPKYKNYRRWLCGGVIIHEEYILTSAACIEDARHFYIVSGTYSFNEGDDRYNNECIKNGAKKAVWKCIPKNYVFDGHENDNIRWMNNDIAIVKAEDEFDFSRRVKGCDFVPKPIRYNNETSRHEQPENSAIIAGWGSTDTYNDGKGQETTTQNLLETSVLLITKKQCKRHWGPRYHNIIDNYMICSQDITADLSEPCNEKYVECKDITYSEEDTESRRVLSENELALHSAYHNETRRTDPRIRHGGFCENDHGGPLIYIHNSDPIVIGIISACLVKERTNKCYGPFLYTSVFKNRVLINCAIYKDHRGACSKVFRSGDTHREEEITWNDHPDGPAKNEEAKMRRTEGNINTNETLKSLKREQLTLDKVVKHEGVILRTSDDPTKIKMESANSTA